MKKTTILPIPFVFVLTLTILITFRSWFSMVINLQFWSLLLAILIIATGSKYLRFDNKAFVLIFLCLIADLTFTRGNINAYIGAILNISPFLVFCAIRPQVRINILIYFNKIFAVIVGASTFFWILHLLGVPLPHSRLDFGEFYTYDNYYFFLDVILSISYLDFFPRFHSIFVEPSIIGILCPMMLFLDGFRMKKWYNIVYLVALLLTFSLGGFVLFAIALIPHVLYGSAGQSRSRIGYIFIVLVMLGIGYYAMYVADQSSIIYQMLGQRLEWNEDTGTISGYDRSGADINDFLAKRFWNSDNVFFGFGPDFKFDGVDIKVFLVKYGVVTLVLYIFLLFGCYMTRKSKYGFWWLFLVFMAFYRGYSVMFWPGFLMLYLMGLDYLSYSKNKALNAWETVC